MGEVFEDGFVKDQGLESVMANWQMFILGH